MFGGLQNINFGAIEKSILPPSLQDEAAEAIKIAKAGTIAVVSLQAIAALSALGMLIIAAKTYTKMNRKSKRRTSKRTKKPSSVVYRRIAR